MAKAGAAGAGDADSNGGEAVGNVGSGKPSECATRKTARWLNDGFGASGWIWRDGGRRAAKAAGCRRVRQRKDAKSSKSTSEGYESGFDPG